MFTFALNVYPCLMGLCIRVRRVGGEQRKGQEVGFAALAPIFRGERNGRVHCVYTCEENALSSWFLR